MELVGAPGLRGGVDRVRQQPGEAFAGRDEAVAPEHALDGARAGQRADVQALQLGQDGGSEAVVDRYVVMSGNPPMTRRAQPTTSKGSTLSTVPRHQPAGRVCSWIYDSP